MKVAEEVRECWQPAMTWTPRALHHVARSISSPSRSGTRTQPPLPYPPPAPSPVPPSSLSIPLPPLLLLLLLLLTSGGVVIAVSRAQRSVSRPIACRVTNTLRLSEQHGEHVRRVFHVDSSKSSIIYFLHIAFFHSSSIPSISSIPCGYSTALVNKYKSFVLSLSSYLRPTSFLDFISFLSSSNLLYRFF